MRILFITRNDSKEIFGGDTIQYLKTKEFLEKLSNIQINIKTLKETQKEDIEMADIIHIWGIPNMQHSDLNILKTAKQKNKKICASSIFWDVSECYVIRYIYQFLEFIPYIVISMIKIFIFICIRIALEIDPRYRATRNVNFFYPASAEFRGKVILTSDIIIPNSIEEGEQLCKCSCLDYEEVKSKFVPIPNAVDIEFIKKHKDTSFMSEVKDFVVEAAGIEPLKNQLGLLKALYKNSEIPIIFAGQVRNEKYYNELKKLADKRGNVYFTGKISQEDLFSLYKRAKVHVLASFRESPGLATLESLMCGSQIVVSGKKYCPVNYYQFDKYGFICNPYNTKSIKKAVLEAYYNPKDINLSDEYIKFFSYENVADMTYKVYKKLMEDKND